MASFMRLLGTAVLILTVHTCLAWDNDELEIFDLVEEVNANFYELMGLDQEASSSEIRRAYRKLTLQYHPDKNKADDAEEKFRQLVAVYEVLKDEQKRQMYNRVLVEGLPDWRTPVFYYRRARKMGLAELTGLLGLIVTVGQYLFGWAVYIERRLTLEDMIDSKKKKEKRKKTKASEEAEELQEEMASLPKPSFLDLWPFRLPGFLCWCVQGLPRLVALVREEIAERRRQRQEMEEEEEEDGDYEKVSRKPKRRKMEVPEYSPDTYERSAVMETQAGLTAVSDQQGASQSSVKDGEWSEEELVLLAKAVNKFPGGTPKRWEKIANMVGRSVDEVCLKSKTMKGTYTMNLSAEVQGNVLTAVHTKMGKKNQRISDGIITTADGDNATTATANTNSAPPHPADSDTVRHRHKPTKIPRAADRTLTVAETVPARDTSSGKGDAGHGKAMVGDLNGSGEGNQEGDSWTQNQQVIFEYALRQFPKGTDKRWDKIAEQIPGKTKEDCIVRFKYLAELVKKRKTENQPA